MLEMNAVPLGFQVILQDELKKEALSWMNV